MQWFYISKNDSKTGILLENLEDIATPKSDFLSCKVEKKGWGLAQISPKGELQWKISPIYEDANSFSEGLLPCRNDEKWGFVNIEGHPELKPQWDYALPFSQERAVVCQGEKRGIIDRRGSWIVSPKVDILRSYSNDVAVGQVAQKWFILDLQGRVLSTPSVAFLRAFSENLAAFNEGGQILQGQLVMGGQWGFLNKHGEIMIPAKFSWVGNFVDGWAPYYLEEENEWGLLSHEGNRTPVLGVSGIRSYQKEEMIVEKDDLWAVMTRDGQEIMPPTYDSLQFFGNRGYLGVREK